MNDTQDDLDRQIRRLDEELPDSAQRLKRWLERPSARWARIAIGIGLIVAGTFGFLPVLGWWMLPLGLLLLSYDLPFLKQPAHRLLLWLERHRKDRKDQ
ncbi:MAG: hypothetical protein WCY11_19560 [Novosphingobium sp.]